jgi:hypothetical protein
MEEGKEAMRAYPFRSAISSLMFAMVAMRADLLSLALLSSLPTLASPTIMHW